MINDHRVKTIVLTTVPGPTKINKPTFVSKYRSLYLILKFKLSENMVQDFLFCLTLKKTDDMTGEKGEVEKILNI